MPARRNGMIRTIVRYCIASCALAAFLLAARDEAVGEDFYAGKTITIIVSGGGEYEAYARAFAQYMPKYIPGHPNMIVQLMPGGGGLQAANFMYKIAPKDGTYIAGTHGAVVVARLLTPDVAEFDTTKFGWIGNATQDTYLAYVWNTAPVRTFDEAKTKQLIVGGSSVGSAGIDYAIIARNLFGFNLKIVSGYKTSPETKLAMQRGEIHGTMGNALSSLNSTDWLAIGKVRVLLQHGGTRLPEFPDVPLFRDYARTDAERQMLDILGVREEISKPYFAPPGIPKDRLAILRQAFDAAMADPDFRARVAQQKMLITNPLNSEQLTDVVDKVSVTPTSTVQQLVSLLKNYKDAK
jgi:tripartite-type tricarboxylate transporter receptor subunit TctC